MAIDVFISYHVNSSQAITKAICNCLESHAIRCWYAPRDTVGAYANCIVDAINECKVFVPILNREASFSEDVLNEINIAVQRVRAGEEIAIIPFRVSEEDISKDAQYYLGRQHWIDAITPPLGEHIQELLKRVLAILGRTSDIPYTEKQNGVIQESLRSTPHVKNNDLLGREEELELLHQLLVDNRMVFITGIGGTGKTELVNLYIDKHQTEYKSIIVAKYESSLVDLIINEEIFQIKDFVRNNAETEMEFARRKLQKIRELTDINTLIVIDNFDTSEDLLLDELLHGPYRIIFTTRVNYEYLGISVMQLHALRYEHQIALFKKNYKRPVSEMQMNCLDEILHLVDGHTLTIELIARLMAAKRMKFETMLEELSKVGISSMDNGVVHHKTKTKTTAYSHIKALFDLDALSEEEQSVMQNLSVFPLAGVSFERFMEWCCYESGEVINDLIDRNWIKYDIEHDIISLHPVVADIVRAECDVSFKTCQTMVNNLAEWFSVCWNMHIQEKSQCGEIAKSLYYKICLKEKIDINIYFQLFKVFRTLGFYDLADDLAEQMKQILGEEPSVELGKLYYEIGDSCACRMNYDMAVEFLEKSIEILSLVKPNSYELAYVIKHLAHICHAIYENKEVNVYWIEKARTLLKNSGDIFANCVDECSAQMGSQLYALGTNCYYFGEYERALDYEQRSFDIFMKLNGEIDPDTHAPMVMLARIYSKMGQLDAAVEMQKRVLNTRGELWEKNHLKYFRQYEHLADIYLENGRISEAIEELQNLLECITQENSLYDDYLKKIYDKIDYYKKKQNLEAGN